MMLASITIPTVRLAPIRETAWHRECLTMTQYNDLLLAEQARYKHDHASDLKHLMAKKQYMDRCCWQCHYCNNFFECIDIVAQQHSIEGIRIRRGDPEGSKAHLKRRKGIAVFGRVE